MIEDKTPPKDHDAELAPEKDFSPGPGQMKLPGKQLRRNNSHFSSGKMRLVKRPIQISIILLAVILLAGIGYLGWRYFDKRSSGQTSQQTGPEIGQGSLTESYTSDGLRLDFRYPQGWNVNEGAGGIRIESPEFSYQKSDGNSVQGYFRIYIRQGARDVDSKYIGNGKVIQPSETIVYTDPVPGQRKTTYLSAFDLDEAGSFNFFLVQGNFNLKTGDTLGPKFGTEFDAYIIAGGYSSKDNSEDLQMNSVPADFYTQNNTYQQAVEIVKSLQLR